MKPGSAAAPTTVDEYIAAFSPEVRRVLQGVRQVARAAAPDAQEVISYRMPALKQDGVLVYFAAFKNHIGLYPPVHGDPDLLKAIAPYAGEKGNLRFPLDQPIPITPGIISIFVLCSFDFSESTFLKYVEFICPKIAYLKSFC